MALNPQQIAFKEAYCNPESETFGNAKRSGIAAGFDEEYSETLTSPSKNLQWVQEIVRDLEMAQKAKEVLNKTLAMVDHEDTARVKIAQDSAKFLSERIGGMGEKKQVDITSGGEKLEVTLTPAVIKANQAYEEAMKKALINNE